MLLSVGEPFGELQINHEVQLTYSQKRRLVTFDIRGLAVKYAHPRHAVEFEEQIYDVEKQPLHLVVAENGLVRVKHGEATAARGSLN